MITNTQNNVTFSLPYKKTINDTFRCRSCDTNLTSNTTSNQFQRLKLIQKTVRVDSSLYAMNRAALTVYKKPTTATFGVCWNQQSDRPLPSISRATVPSGSGSSMAVSHKGGQWGYGGRSYTQTSSRPGGQTPGGVGCDIKHNSYARYLNRIKGKAPLRQEGAPINFGGYLPFNLAYPVYGGKTMKTGIISGCDCSNTKADNTRLYDNKDNLYSNYFTNITYTIAIGDDVYAIPPCGVSTYLKAKVLYIFDNSFVIQFDNGIIDTQKLYQLKEYKECIKETSPALYIKDIYDVENFLGVSCLYPKNEFIDQLFD